MSEDEENKSDISNFINSVPDEGKGLSIATELSDEGVKELVITHPEIKNEYRRQQENGLYNVESFALYVNQEFVDKDFVYINDDCHAYIGVEETNKDSKYSHLIPKMHPSFERLLNNGQKAITPKEFQKILYPFRKQITNFRVLLTQIKVSKSTEIFEGKKQGVVCTTKFQGEEKSELVEIPESVEIVLTPYLGYGTQKIELSIDPLEQGGNVGFVYEIYNLEEMKLDVCAEIKTKLRELIKEGIHIIEGYHNEHFKEIV